MNDTQIMTKEIKIESGKGMGRRKAWEMVFGGGGGGGGESEI